MIEHMNVTTDMKNLLKLLKLIFIIIIYLHCLGCLWFVVVETNEEWKPHLEYVDPNANFYESNLSYTYFINLYHAVLMLTGNDILPRGTL